MDYHTEDLNPPYILTEAKHPTVRFSMEFLSPPFSGMLR